MASQDPHITYTQMHLASGAQCQAPSCSVIDYHPFQCNSCRGKFCRQHRTESAHSCLHAGTSATRQAGRLPSNDADLDNIGAHCQIDTCNRLDFLPFKCPSCKGTFCSEHNKEDAHACPKAGAWLAGRREQRDSSSAGPRPSKPTILTHDQQCAHPKCKTLINTPLVQGIDCAPCGRSYCLKHRMPEEHACSTLPRPEKLKDRGITTAMGRLKAWGAQRKDKQPVQGFRKIPVSDPSQSPPKETNALTRIISPFTAARMKKSQAAFLTSTNTLKKNAKGDDKIPREKRVYVHLEAVAEGEGHAGAKIPRADAFYSAEWSVGKVLDAAAKMLTVINVNNRGGGEEQKLRVFSVETGRLLEFSEKLGSVTKTGDTLVLLRGVGQTDVP